VTLALVLGGALTVWDDVEAALALTEADGIVACNDIAADWPGPLDAAATLHPEFWPRWAARRAAKGYPPVPRVFFNGWAFPGQDRSGSSGLFALKVALVDLGYDRAVLCGVPMDERARHIANFKPWRGAQTLRAGWVQALPAIADRARSMSGWTADLLGRPTPDWLAS
jgi:hypothetical protein